MQRTEGDGWQDACQEEHHIISKWLVLPSAAVPLVLGLPPAAVTSAAAPSATK